MKQDKQAFINSSQSMPFACGKGPVSSGAGVSYTSGPATHCAEASDSFARHCPDTSLGWLGLYRALRPFCCQSRQQPREGRGSRGTDKDGHVFLAPHSGGMGRGRPGGQCQSAHPTEAEWRAQVHASVLCQCGLGKSFRIVIIVTSSLEYH